MGLALALGLEGGGYDGCCGPEGAEGAAGATVAAGAVGAEAAAAEPPETAGLTGSCHTPRISSVKGAGSPWSAEVPLVVRPFLLSGSLSLCRKFSPDALRRDLLLLR